MRVRYTEIEMSNINYFLDLKGLSNVFQFPL